MNNNQEKHKLQNKRRELTVLRDKLNKTVTTGITTKNKKKSIHEILKEDNIIDTKSGDIKNIRNVSFSNSERSPTFLFVQKDGCIHKENMNKYIKFNESMPSDLTNKAKRSNSNESLEKSINAFATNISKLGLNKLSRVNLK